MPNSDLPQKKVLSIEWVAVDDVRIYKFWMRYLLFPLETQYLILTHPTELSRCAEAVRCLFQRLLLSPLAEEAKIMIDLRDAVSTLNQLVTFLN